MAERAPRHSRPRSARVFVVLVALALLLVAPEPVSAHEERPVDFPAGTGSVPRYRTEGPYLVVCERDTPRRIARLRGDLRERNERLYEECTERGFRHIQDAVDAVRRGGTRILVQPGVYREEPSLARLPARCRGLQDEVLTYGQQRRCPHAQNVVAILGDGPDADRACDGRLCELQIEGTGATPRDVVVDGRFRRLNVIRADRADGIYFRNFTVQRAEFNALYVLETDGFAIDRMLGRWNDEYAFLTFASDHGLYVDCEAHGNGDGGLYPGSAAPHGGARPSIEITRCRSHHNTLGYSGTAGNSVYVHHNEFFANSVGAVMDSFFPEHPGMPQDHAVFVENRIHGNNADYYRYLRDGTCDRPLEERGYEHGVVCPSVPAPVGTGILVAGGNSNVFARNWLYDNWRYGAMQFWVPAAVRDEHDPAKQYDTSHFNRYRDNAMGISPTGEARPNGLDFWWDEEGAGNCWEDNRAAGGAPTSDPPAPLLPGCDAAPVMRPGNAAKIASLAPCATWSRENPDPEGCDWMRAPERPS